MELELVDFLIKVFDKDLDFGFWILDCEFWILNFGF